MIINFSNLSQSQEVDLSLAIKLATIAAGKRSFRYSVNETVSIRVKINLILDCSKYRLAVIREEIFSKLAAFNNVEELDVSKIHGYDYETEIVEIVARQSLYLR